MDTSTLLASRVAKPWQGRFLEGFGGSGARFWTHGIYVETSSFLASRVAKPWQGRALEGSGGSGTCFWTHGFYMEMSLLLAWGREALAGPCSRGLWRQQRALLDPWTFFVERSSFLASGVAKP